MQDTQTTDDTQAADTYRCPYPGCDWEPSRPIDSDVRLTQAVVQHEVKSHREQHTGGEK